MSRTLVCVQKALDGEIFTCNVRENGGLASKECKVLQGSQVLQGSNRQLKQAGSLFRGMGTYMNDAGSAHDPLEESEPLEEFNSNMFEDLFKNPHHFLFVEIDSTLVGYVDAHESRFGGYYIRHIFCNKAGLNIGKLLLALAEEKAFREAPETCVMLNFRLSEKLWCLYETGGFRIPIIEEHGIVRHALDPCHSQGMVKYIRSRRGANQATKTVEVGATDGRGEEPGPVSRGEEPGPVSRRTDARYCINEDLSQTLQRILTLK